MANSKLLQYGEDNEFYEHKIPSVQSRFPPDNLKQINKDIAPSKVKSQNDINVSSNMNLTKDAITQVSAG